MVNSEFLETLSESYFKYLESGSRSPKKLVPLHSHIANTIEEDLGNEYKIESKGRDDGREGKINGRYYEKQVDILISKNDEIVGGIAVKFVMSNYSQNSNNYFENMLGETANIRSKRIPYFQVVILFSELPYFKDNGVISRIESLTENNVKKYCILSQDDVSAFFHSPDKVLLYTIKLKDIDLTEFIDLNKDEFKNKILNLGKPKIETVNLPFIEAGQEMVYNDIDDFAKRVAYIIKGRF